MKRSSKPTAKPAPAEPKPKGGVLKQTDVPSLSLEQALRIPKAIAASYSHQPTSPLKVAQALKMQPNSGPFRMLCGAAIAYGLTSGSAYDSEISIEPLGMRIVRPLKEGDDLAARREAFLKPRILSEFLRKYDSSALPRQDIATNVLIDMGVPQAKAHDVLSLILEGAESVGLLADIKGKKYADLSGTPQPRATGENIDTRLPQDGEPTEVSPTETALPPQAMGSERPESQQGARKRRVFLTHGKNKEFIEPIKKLLAFGELEAIVAVERQSVSQPVPDKVMSDMRTCGAAIIHVDAEQRLVDQDANEHIVLNPNVLIEIGAAMALYGRRFILLVKEGVKLPSNLQGLYEVRYSGDSLDGAVTIKLLEAIRDIKNHPLPDQGA